MPAPLPTVLLFTSDPGIDVEAHGEAAARAGVGLRVVSDRVGDLPARWAEGALAASFDRDAAEVDRLRQRLGTAAVDGVLVVGARPAWLAAHLARACGLTWHAPEAVALCTDRLRLRGRFLAAGLPSPWFVGLSATGDDDLGLLARVRFPCLVAPSDATVGGSAIRCDSLDDLLAARASLAAAPHGGGADTLALIVEGVVPGRGFVIDGVLEAGGLRVFAVFEEIAVEGTTATRGRLRVSPARMPPAQQHVVAGHVARAALVVGLHHGPVHATCRVDGDEIVVLSIDPRPPSTGLARALPVVAPDRTRCTFEDALLAHAVGRPLDHYGHQAIASGVLDLQVSGPGQGVTVDGAQEVGRMTWVTGVEMGAGPGDRSAGNRSREAVRVYAQGAQPDDVIATLEDAARRLRVVDVDTARSSS